MENKFTKCPRCSFNFKTDAIFFSCTHIICPYCYLNDIFKTKITSMFNISFGYPLIVKCSQCSNGEYKTSLDQFVSYLNTNNFIFPICDKHNKQTNIFCKKCKIFLCSDCEKLFHNNYFKNHKDKLTKYPTFENGIKFCDIHNKKIKYKCKECKDYTCSICVKENHIGHKIEKIDDIVNKALNNIQFSTYDKYLKFLSQREVKIKDQIHYDYNKQIDEIDFTIKQLEILKNNCIIIYEESFKYLTSLYNFQRSIYYYYYNYFDSNNIEYNPILSYEKKVTEIKKEPELRDKRIFVFLNVNVLPPIATYSFNDVKHTLIEYNKKKEYKFPISQLFIYPRAQLSIKDDYDIQKGNKVTSLCFLPNKNYAVGTKSGVVYLYQSSPPFSLISSFRAHLQKISSLSTIDNVRPKLLVTCSYDKTINFYDLGDKEYKIVKTFKGHKGEITSMIAINNEKKLDEEEMKTKKILLISAGKDKNIKIWSIEEMKYLRTLTGHKGNIRCLMRLNEKEIMSSGDDMLIMQWDVYTYACLKTFNPNVENSIKFLSLLGASQIGFAKTKGGFEFIKAGTFEKIVGPIINHNDDITGICLLKETSQLITCSLDRRMILFDLENFGENCFIVTGHNGKIKKMIVNNDPGQSQVITAGEDGQIIIWEIAY